MTLEEEIKQIDNEIGAIQLEQDELCKKVSGLYDKRYKIKNQIYLNNLKINGVNDGDFFIHENKSYGYHDDIFKLIQITNSKTSEVYEYRLRYDDGDVFFRVDKQKYSAKGLISELSNGDYVKIPANIANEYIQKGLHLIYK